VGSVLMSFCQQLGYRSTLVVSGQDAIEKFREHPPP